MKNNILTEEIRRINSLISINNSSDLIKESVGPGKGIFDEVIPGGAKTLDNMSKLSKTYDDLFDYSKRMSDLVPSKNIDDFIDLVGKQYNTKTVTPDMLKSFIANDPILKKELMEAAAKIAEERVTSLMKNLSFVEVFNKAGLPDVPKSIKQILSYPVDESTKSYITAGLDSIEDFIIKNQYLKNSTEGKEILDQIVGKRKQISDYDSINSKSTVNTNDPQSYLNNLSKEELESKLGSYSWKNIGYTQELFSGWKFHIFGEDIKDAIYLQDALKPVIDKYKPTAKVGGTYQNSSESFKLGQKQHGKQGVTIYIPPYVINSGKQQEMLSDIQSALKGYTKGGTIVGDQAITPSIHYRYELMGPIPKNGIDYPTYSKMYSANEGGEYKPSDVEDLFTSQSVKTSNPISNGFLSSKFGDTSKINWSVITNAKNISDYDVIIDNAMKTGDFSKISRYGFEEYGIPNFREYLMNLNYK
jgi:hypothetical protein